MSDTRDKNLTRVRGINKRYVHTTLEMSKTKIETLLAFESAKSLTQKSQRHCGDSFRKLALWVIKTENYCPTSTLIQQSKRLKISLNVPNSQDNVKMKITIVKNWDY